MGWSRRSDGTIMGERRGNNELSTISHKYVLITTDLSCGVDNMTIILDALIHHALRKCRLDSGVIRVHKMILEWPKKSKEISLTFCKFQFRNKFIRENRRKSRFLKRRKAIHKGRIPTYLNELLHQRRLSYTEKMLTRSFNKDRENERQERTTAPGYRGSNKTDMTLRKESLNVQLTNRPRTQDRNFSLLEGVRHPG